MTDTAKATIKNNSRAPQGVWAQSNLEWIQPGHQRTLTLTDVELATVQAYGFMSADVHPDDGKAKPQEAPEAVQAPDAPADPEPAPEPAREAAPEPVAEAPAKTTKAKLKG